MSTQMFRRHGTQLNIGLQEPSFLLRVGVGDFIDDFMAIEGIYKRPIKFSSYCLRLLSRNAAVSIVAELTLGDPAILDWLPS